jgi:molecular chaperone GrpE (heat shock protein)
MYYTSYHYIQFGLREQAERTNALQQMSELENQVKRCQNEIKNLRQQARERELKLQVSKAGFSFIEITIICFVLPF